MNKKTKAWIEAMRLRTLPVSVAGVVAGGGCAAFFHSFKAAPFFICLAFAVLAQIVSNFANEYFDFKKGLDRKGRDGFRRGVTEGDISPAAMLRATILLLLVTCAIGSTLIIWGGWWLIAVGVAVAVFALAYSAGPWPLSHHGLGEIAVIVFFGLVPVTLTTYVQTGSWEMWRLTLPIALAIGLMGANVIIVNNYRDADDDKAVGKKTLAVTFGRGVMSKIYFINGVAAMILVVLATIGKIPVFWQIGAFLYVNQHYLMWQKLKNSKGAELNPVLGQTAFIMFVFACWIAFILARAGHMS